MYRPRSVVLRRRVLTPLALKTVALKTVALWAVALAAVPSSLEAQSPQPTDQRFGFSRFLPDDVDGYLSLMQGGRVVRTVGESNAWQQMVPEVRDALMKLHAQRTAPDLPPESHMAIELSDASLESEITVATRPDVSKNLMGLAKLGLLSFGGFAPSRFEPDSPDGLAMAKKQAAMRREWVETVPTIQVPSFVVAVRISEPAKFDLFVRTAIAQGRKALLAELNNAEPDAKLSPDALLALEGAMAPVEIGKATLWRFRLQLGDVFPASTVAKKIKNWPLDEAQREATAAAVAKLKLDVHAGFVGEYLTLAVGSDDALIRSIVDRYEGRSGQTLAASEAFAPIRAELTPNTIGILYADSTASQKELYGTLLPMLRSYTDPEFLSLFGLPPEVGPQITRFRMQVERLTSDVPQKQFSVLQLEDGLKQVSHWEFDRDPVERSTEPLEVLGAVPATTLGLYVYREASLEPIWDQFRHFIEQFEARLSQFEMRSGDDPKFAENAANMRVRMRDVLRPVNEKLEPSMRGQSAMLLGPFVPFAVEGPAGADVPEFSIPTGAVVIGSPSPDRAIEGFTELFQAVMALVDEINPRGADLPLKFDAREVDGVEYHVLSLKGVSVKGLEPNVALIGDWLVVSTSLELSKQIRNATAGKAPAITAAPAYRAVAKYLPATADELMYFDGDELNRSVRETADRLFSAFEEKAEQRAAPKRTLDEIAAAKRITDAVLNVTSTFRLAYGTVVAEGRTNVLRNWIRIEDLPPE